jgi:hypothetical protein
MIATISPQPAYTRTIEWAKQTTVARAAICQSAERTRWSAVIRSLLGLRALQNDWAGEGSDAPLPEVHESAVRLAEFLRDRGVKWPDSAVASRAGTVIFAWRYGKLYREIEVVGPGKYEWLAIDDTGGNTHGAFSLSLGESNIY